MLPYAGTRTEIKQGLIPTFWRHTKHAYDRHLHQICLMYLLIGSGYDIVYLQAL